MGIPLLLLLSLISCQKESRIDPPPALDQIVEKVNQWIDLRAKEAPTKRQQKVSDLKASLDLQNFHIENYKGGSQLVVIPVKQSFISENNSGKNLNTWLVVVMNAQGNLTRGNLIQYYPLGGGNKSIPKNTFSKVYTYQNLDCNGKFTIIKVDDKFLAELEFKNRKLRSVSTRTHKQAAANTRTSSEFCVEWYLITTVYYDDGSTEVFESYVGRDCFEEEEVQIPEGGGGGGGPIEYIYEQARVLTWVVGSAASGAWTVKSYETAKGKKDVSNPLLNTFISMTHNNSAVFNNSNLGATWQELVSLAQVNSSLVVSSNVQGKVSFPVQTPSPPIPDVSVARTEHWGFTTVFP